MEIMQGFVGWLANRPTPDEICRALVTDYLKKHGACCVRLGRLNKDDSYHYLGEYGFDLNETGKLVPGQIWRLNKDIEVNQIAAGHQPGPWTRKGDQVLLELRARGSVYGWMNLKFSRTLKDEEKKTAFTEAQLFALATSLYLSLTHPQEFSSEKDLGVEKGIPSVDSLTKRQMNILRGMVDGKTNHDLATQLGYSVSTIRHETMRIYQALAVSDRREAAQRALEYGWV
ncbi:MAG: response regulator transcription factor [Candidatus Nanopelagicaceae bacterium]